MTATTARHTLRTAHEAVAQRANFTCNGTLTGHSGGFPYMGRLDQPYKDQCAQAALADDFYVVKSYATPIAWHANGQWTVPGVKYSVTTSRHQGIVRRAIIESIH